MIIMEMLYWLELIMIKLQKNILVLLRKVGLVEENNIYDWGQFGDSFIIF